MRLKPHVYAYTLVCIAMIALAVGPMKRHAVYIYEDISYALHPSAQYAFELGNTHFNAAANPRSYDIDRARDLYFKAAQADIDHPMIFQQLARTSFVRGDYGAALTQINLQFAKHPDSNASAYYIRALIFAFMGRYEESAADYRSYIERDPATWAAYNDLAWMLLRLHKADEALAVIDRGLSVAPENAWLLTSRTTALVELGQYEEAHEVALRAAAAAQTVTREEWALQYKGNDPKSISKGISELVEASKSNVIKIEQLIAASTTVRAR